MQPEGASQSRPSEQSGATDRKHLLRQLRHEETVVSEHAAERHAVNHAVVRISSADAKSTTETDRPAAVHPVAGSAVSVRPVYLGSHRIDVPMMLSPMAGVTNWPFRTLCEGYGQNQGLYVAEMITARALVDHNPKALRLLRFAPSETFRSVQLYAVDLRIASGAAKLIVDNNWADHIDLNFGCPVPKVTRHGGGSALPWKTDLYAEVIRRVVAAAQPAGIPVTAKFRVGLDHEHETFLDAGHIAQEEGAAAVTLHARTTAEYYGGHSDWSRIAELKQAVSIPVFGNGDIWTAEDGLAMMAQTGCDGIAIGRGCQGRPWIFADILHAFAGSPERANLTLGEVCSVILTHVRRLTDFYDGNEQMAVHDMRKHVAWYLKGYPVGGQVRRRFMESESLADFEAVIADLNPDLRVPEEMLSRPRGRVSYQKKIHVPYGWLDSRVTTPEQREILFGADPYDAEY